MGSLGFDVCGVINEKIVYDAFDCSEIDLSAINELTDKIHGKALKTFLPNLIEYERKKGTHVLSIKISYRQTRLYKYLLESGFLFNQSHSDFSILTICLKKMDHCQSECTFPKHKTATVGITAVVFNRELTKFLAVQELTGPYKNWKPPTGSVDYELGDTPERAAVREVKEETNVSLKAEDGCLIGSAWTPFYRKTNPDINYTYAFQTDELAHQLKCQQSEIKAVRWIVLEEYLNSENNYPNFLKEVVKTASNVFKEGRGWRSQSLVSPAGKQILYVSAMKGQ